MALGYRVVEPSGKVRFMKSENREHVTENVQTIQDKWSAYCDRNWLNDTGDVYTPEIKVKRLLDSLAYYLLLGNTDGIETEYRRVMHAKREIPVSSCSLSVDNIFYSNGGSTDAIDRDEEERFKLMLDRLDQRAERYDHQQKQKKKIESGQHKRTRIGIHGGEWCRVDTDGKFWLGNKHYIINDQAVQYAPVETEFGEYYAMDKILASGGKFYDMNYDEVEVSCIGGYLKYEDYKDLISVG